MTPEDEIKAVGEVVQAARDNADVHLKHAEADLHVGGAALAHYRDFLDASVLNARSILARCSDLVSVPAIAAEPSTSNIVRGLLGTVRESVQALYLAMMVLDQSVGPAGPGAAGPAPAPNEPAPEPGGRSCSFCGKTDAEAKLVAGPAGNICASCTRLACGILGISL
jgi:ClpX C4-type zinc finger